MNKIIIMVIIIDCFLGFIKVIYHLTGLLRNSLSEFNVISTIFFIIADIVKVENWRFSACLGCHDILGELGGQN